LLGPRLFTTCSIVSDADTNPSYLAGLNQPQTEAVLASEGPVLVLAGAGTGKTRVLTTRLTHLIATRRAWPSEILAVTFTNKAAREMQARTAAMIGQAVEGMRWLGTFHSVAARMLRQHADLVGLKSNFTILDTDDQLRLLKQVIAASDLDERRWPARSLAGLIDRWKNRGWIPSKVSEEESAQFADGRGRELYASYQARLLQLNASDFGDLLVHCLTIFTSHSDILSHYQRRFRYILVDEYQDTNVAQYLWLRLLAQEHRNICCVGDDDQSIYSWRGAEIANILRFEQDFPGARVIRLEQNYRSTSHILGAAGGLIQANGGRLGKTLWTDAGNGSKVSVIGVWDGPEEARVIGEESERLQRAGAKRSDIAILVRAQFQTREFEDRFIAIGLPYRIVGGFRFYERQEIRDALAYLRVIVQPADDLAFERIVNTPKRGLGDKSLSKIHSVARARGTTLTSAAAALVESDELPPAARRALARLMADIGAWRSKLDQMSAAELTRLVLEESQYLAMWQAERSADAAGRVDNLMELTRAIEEFETVASFLEHVALVMDNDAADASEQVTIMTLHGAKGLEFDTVFLPGWEEGVFPNQRALDEGGLASLEEERRLAYVGLTRARRKAYVLHAANRRIYGQWTSSIPSRFIAELPSAHVSTETTMTGGQSLWRAALGSSDPFAHVGRASGRGPGWSRAVAANESGTARATGVREAGTLIEGRARVSSVGTPARSDVRIGSRVFHSKFGYGSVSAIDGNKLEVDFDKAGAKRVLDSFVEIS
jgi:DNA helicase-2/ATP-dependent DNA helicase PcrA